MFSDRITSDDCSLQPRFPLFLHDLPRVILGEGSFGVNFLLGGSVKDAELELRRLTAGFD
jgi:hypothetical protein